MKKTVAGVSGLLAWPASAYACPICFGQDDAAMTRATSLGIMAMLVVVALVLAGVAAFILTLRRRALAVSEPPRC